MRITNLPDSFTAYFKWKQHNAACERQITFGTRSEHGLGTACSQSYMFELAFNVTSVSNSLKPLYIVIILYYIVIVNVSRPTVTK